MRNRSAVHTLVGNWYQVHARDLPWRNNPDAYAILISELMLQQTQVDRVVPKYLHFLTLFPSIESLARARLSDVIKAWAGLGYNVRAVRLHRLAGHVVTHLEGRLPTTVEGLRALPGVGVYTAAAVACFAFGVTTPVLDTNIYRVLSRVFRGSVAPVRAEIDHLALEMMPDPSVLGVSEWHQGLMDLGATVCTSARPRCRECPLLAECAAAPVLASDPSPAVAQASVPKFNRQSAYIGSRRYFRGKIVDLLRAAPNNRISIQQLHELLGSVEPYQLDDLIIGLAGDGLVVRARSMIEIPELDQQIPY